MTHSMRTCSSYEEALAWLDRHINYERVSDYKTGPFRIGTERIQELLRRLENPQTAAPVLHIAGTKGKGSIATMTARLLTSCGYRVGLYTSPHLSCLRERIQIGARWISETDFCEAYTRVQPVVEEMKTHPTFKPPTYFEILTSLAFIAFQKAEVDVIVLEVGLGGRLDATNVADLPVVASAISTISKDHTRQLGNDLLSIAGEKAGILRKNTPAVLGLQEKGVLQYLEARAAEQAAPLRLAGKDVEVILREPLAAQTPEAPQRLDVQTWRARHHDVALPLLGDHQRNNAAVAIALVELFLEHTRTGPLDTASIRKAWRNLHIPARMELMAREPWILLDGAHNPASAWALAETISQRFAGIPCTLLFAANDDKDVGTMLRILCPLMKRIVLTRSQSPRSLPPEEMKKQIPPSMELEVRENGAAALDEIRKGLDRNELLVITGSLYLAGELRPRLWKEE